VPAVFESLDTDLHRAPLLQTPACVETEPILPEPLRRRRAPDDVFGCSWSH
jgi:hypothetical protein